MVSLKVDGLSHRTSIEDLEALFDKYGRIGDVYIPKVRSYLIDNRIELFVVSYAICEPVLFRLLAECSECLAVRIRIYLFVRFFKSWSWHFSIKS
jgi:hypothetical protein